MGYLLKKFACLRAVDVLLLALPPYIDDYGEDIAFEHNILMDIKPRTAARKGTMLRTRW
jgi:hypothetical protein